VTSALGAEGGVPVWCRKTRMAWLPEGEKKFDEMSSRFDKILACDGRTGILRQHIPRCAPRGKNAGLGKFLGFILGSTRREIGIVMLLSPLRLHNYHLENFRECRLNEGRECALKEDKKEFAARSRSPELGQPHRAT